MSVTYGPHSNWPQPYAYSQWFASLTPEYQNYYMQPHHYNIIYEKGVNNFPPPLTSTPKISRNQKKKAKLAKLKQ